VLDPSTVEYVTKDNRINLRMGPGHDRIVAMAAAMSDEFKEVRPVDVYRTLLAEAMASRTRNCAASHRGPIRAGHCGHCGGTA
jgi:hypothetical protein